MPASPVTIASTSPDHTAALAVSLSASLQAGDVLLLEGPVGAGKTHFARHLVQALLNEQEDVPSPTFTIVQTYETKAGPLWHCDLYRITSTLDIEELGLVDAFEDAICLVEWPDRLGELTPETALRVDFAQGATDDMRRISASWTDARWSERLKTWATE